MPKDLDSKVACLVQDIEKLNQFDKARVIKQFVLTELGFQECEHEVDFNSLVQIHSRATTISRDLPTNFEATYDYFRTQKLTPYRITFRNRK